MLFKNGNGSCLLRQKIYEIPLFKVAKSKMIRTKWDFIGKNESNKKWHKTRTTYLICKSEIIIGETRFCDHCPLSKKPILCCQDERPEIKVYFFSPLRCLKCLETKKSYTFFL